MTADHEMPPRLARYVASLGDPGNTAEPQSAAAPAPGHEPAPYAAQTRTPDGHIDPAWHAQIKAAQTARVEADKAARAEASVRACPVTGAELERYGRIGPEPAVETDRPEIEVPG